MRRGFREPERLVDRTESPRPKGRVGRRAGTCRACTNWTTDYKPYCIDHLDRLAYPAKIAAEVADRCLADDLAQHLAAGSIASAPLRRLALDLRAEPDALRAAVRVLTKRGLARVEVRYAVKRAKKRYELVVATPELLARGREAEAS